VFQHDEQISLEKAKNSTPPCTAKMYRQHKWDSSVIPYFSLKKPGFFLEKNKIK
jgi:hypothetical protein